MTALQERLESTLDAQTSICGRILARWGCKMGSESNPEDRIEIVVRPDHAPRPVEQVTIPLTVSATWPPNTAPAPFLTRLDHFLDKWLFWRGPMALVWYWLVAVLVNRIASQDILPCTNWLLLAPGVTSLYLLLRRRALLILWLPAYFLIFPLLFLGSLSGNLQRSHPLVKGIFRIQVDGRVRPPDENSPRQFDHRSNPTETGNEPSA